LIDKEVLGSSGDAVPSDDLLGALAAGTAVSPLVADGTTGPEDLAVASLPLHDATLLRASPSRITDDFWVTSFRCRSWKTWNAWP